MITFGDGPTLGLHTYAGGKKGGRRLSLYTMVVVGASVVVTSSVVVVTSVVVIVVASVVVVTVGRGVVSGGTVVSLVGVSVGITPPSTPQNHIAKPPQARTMVRNTMLDTIQPLTRAI